MKNLLKNTDSRIHNSMRNTTIGLTLLILSYINNFIYRTVFLNFFSLEYLGVSSALVSVIAILSLTELGFGTTVVYFLYKPLGIDRDEKKVAQILNFLKKAYFVMAMVTLTLGCALFPFLDTLIKEELSLNPDIKIIYWFFVFGNMASYLGAHKSVVLSADQKEYIVKTSYYLAKIFSQILIMVLLYIVKTYWIVLVLENTAILMQNIFLVIYVNKRYPYINQKTKKLPKAEIKEMAKITGSMFVNKAGTVVLNSTASLIITGFISTVVAGMYANYFMIIAAVNTFIYIIFSAVTAGIGNYVLKETKEKSYQLYQTVNLITSWIAAFAGIGILLISDSFMRVWLGEAMLFKPIVVVLLSLSVFLENMARSNEMFVLPLNLSTRTVGWGITYVVVNIVVSVLLVKYLGLAGVFLGTITARLIVFVGVSFVVNGKRGFDHKYSDYALRILYYVVVTIVAFAASYFATRFTLSSKILDCLIKVIIVTVVANAVIFLLTFFTKPFNKVKDLIPEKIKRVFIRKSK